ncbi:hypothetical protein JCM3766R1_000954 [Sporobolomyces carnicolor]
MAWKRLIRFIADEDGEVHYGDCLTRGDIGVLDARGDKIQARPLVDFATRKFDDEAAPLTVRKLLAPLSHGSVTAIRGLGLQYAPPTNPNTAAPDTKANVTPPRVPCLFLKPTTTLAGPRDEIVIPECALEERNDYEVELCVVIGDRDCPKDTPERDAMQYVLGFTVVNDVTSRGLCGQGGAGQWGVGKNFDSWCPIGPCIVNPASLENPDSLELRTTLNGKVVQRGNTSQLLLSIPKLIAALSRGSTLSRHSLILTGSPVAIGRSSPTEASRESPFLKHGDVVECWVEGIGTLVNTIREEGTVTKAKL